MANGLRARASHATALECRWSAPRLDRTPGAQRQGRASRNPSKGRVGEGSALARWSEKWEREGGRQGARPRRTPGDGPADRTIHGRSGRPWKGERENLTRPRAPGRTGTLYRSQSGALTLTCFRSGLASAGLGTRTPLLRSADCTPQLPIRRPPDKHFLFPHILASHASRKVLGTARVPEWLL
jgi:hypothetical protein